MGPRRAAKCAQYRNPGGKLPVSVQIPTPLRSFAGGNKTVGVPAGDVGGALADLVRQHPPLRQHLYTEGGDLRGFVGVYLNDDNVRDLDGPATPVAEGDTLIILPSIAGG
jgi:molybdopterin converting factor small subunit